VKECHFSPAKLPSAAFQGLLQGQNCDCICKYEKILHLRTDSSDVFVRGIKFLWNPAKTKTDDQLWYSYDVFWFYLD